MKIQALPLEPATEVAIRIQAPAQAVEQSRAPAHFVLVLDTSESMSLDDKLGNVKHSASLVLPFLGPADHLSLVTFGSESKIHCRAVPCDAAHKAILESKLRGIEVDGCTNLSSALLHVRQVLSCSSGSAVQLPPGTKTGVLLLTDGHANRGISTTDGLCNIMRTIQAEFPAVAFHVVGYGTDHNADLLKEFAEMAQGSYSIVDSLEGAATVIGDTLGGIFSCVAQQVVVQLPAGTTVRGSYPCDSQGRITIGDLYEGAETILLATCPGPLERATVDAVLLPSLQTVSATWAGEPIAAEELDALRLSVSLTQARYECADLFKMLRVFAQVAPTAAERADATIRISAFRDKVFAATLDGNAVAEMLRAECQALEEALRQVGTPAVAPDLYLRVSQHAAFTTLGRGTTQPIAAALPPRARLQRQRAVYGGGAGAALSAANSDAEEDPVQPRTSLSAAASQVMTSPYRSRAQRAVGGLMATMSAGGADAAAMREAAGYSQAGAASAAQPDEAHTA